MSAQEQVLVVEVSGLRLGLPTEEVRELLRAVAIRPAAGDSHGLEGEINLRGVVTPVLDLRAWSGIEAKALEPDDVLIVLGAGDRTAAVRADRALGLQAREGGDVRRVTLGDLIAALGQEGPGPARAASLAPHPMPVRAILERRALALAGTQEGAESETIEVATFDLGTRTFALETRFLCRVLPPGELTPVPGTPEHLAGLVNLHGEVLTVFELRPWFGAAIEPRPEGAEQMRLLVLGRGRPEFGLRVDTVHEVQTVPIDAISGAPGARECPWIQGIADGVLIVLDGDALLADERLWIDQTEGAA